MQAPRTDAELRAFHSGQDSNPAVSLICRTYRPLMRVLSPPSLLFFGASARSSTDDLNWGFAVSHLIVEPSALGRQVGRPSVLLMVSG